ncbi:MAG: hypothetical protein LBF33_00390 [Oscillospiraceae bacterium]|jgi:hypothetical protein|nr:hypothetical protein [Oscillospiraceae bacterium]
MCTLKRSQLKVGSIVKPSGFPEEKVVTVENCSLENFINGNNKKFWLCWTIRTNSPKLLRKYLIVDWRTNGIIVWTKSNMNFAPTDSKL